jgi:hypothetical protein
MATKENNLLAKRVVPPMDLTSLNLDDNETTHKTLSAQGTPVGNKVIAFIQIYFLCAKIFKNPSIKIVTVK